MENLVIKKFKTSERKSLIKNLKEEGFFYEAERGFFQITDKDLLELVPYLNQIFDSKLNKKSNIAIVREIALLYFVLVTSVKEHEGVPFYVFEKEYSNIKKASQGELSEAMDIAMANPAFKEVQIILHEEEPDFVLRSFLKSKKEEWKVEDRLI